RNFFSVPSTKVATNKGIRVNRKPISAASSSQIVCLRFIIVELLLGCYLLQFGVKRKLLHESIHLILHIGNQCFIIRIHQYIIYSVHNTFCMLFSHPPAGDGSHTKANTRGYESAFVIKGNHILV